MTKSIKAWACPDTRFIEGTIYDQIKLRGNFGYSYKNIEDKFMECGRCDSCCKPIHVELSIKEVE